MSEELINQLETAAQIIMAPPNLVSNEQRHAAETIFLNFRKSKLPYNICRQILETSQNHYMMFEAAEVIKDAIIRDWTFLADSERNSLRQYLMQYITSHEAAHFVRDRILQVIAIMIKRSSIDDNGRERGALLQEVENLIVNGDTNNKILGCNIIENIMQEYATTVKSTDVGLSWENHLKAKKQFESTDLKRIFQFCIYLLSEVVKNDPPYSDIMVQMTQHLLKILEKVLTWGFLSPVLPKKLVRLYYGIYESVSECDQSPALKLNSEWIEMIYNPDFLPLMFQIYWKVRDVDELAHHSLNCLVQLASLSGTITNHKESKLKYLNNYLMNFLNLVSNTTIRRKESLGISNIVKKLVLFFINDFNKLGTQLQETLLDEFTRLTCHFCDGATRDDESNSDEDTFFNDAFENMLEAWITVLGPDFSTLSKDVHQSCATRIFNKYVQCHLSAPDGNRSIEVLDNRCAVDEDIEENDRTKYKVQLQSVGFIGRTILSHSIPVLFRILESRTDSLIATLPIIQQRAMNINESTKLDNLFEDIHWAVLIAGHVLCMDSDGETSLIPSEIITHSIEMAKNNGSNIDASIKALTSANAKEQVPDNLEQCDHVIRIGHDVMRLCTVEEVAISMKISHFMSPEIGATFMWFLKRWCISYLFPNEDYYQTISPILLGCLGRDSECSKIIVSFILHKITVNLYSFQSEATLLHDTVDLFSDIVCTKQKSIYIIKTEAMVRLINLTEEMQPGTLPPNILRGVYKGLVLAGACLVNPEENNQYYERILNPLKVKFKTLLGQENFARICHNENVQKLIIDLMESFIGIAKGSQMATVELLFNFIAPILSEIPIFLNLYKDYQVIVQLILEVFSQCAKYMLCYLRPLDCKKLYESSLAAVQEYAKCNGNRLSTESFAEENCCQDLSLTLDLLTFILSKDCIDLCTETDTEAQITVTASDVSLFGLKFIIPLMTMELLKFPKLCGQFYRLFVLINDIFPEKIASLPEDMLSILFRYIELGLTNFSSDIVHACLDFIEGMASYTFRHGTLNSPFALALKPFLKLLIDLVLTHQINSDIVSSSSTTIYALICCFREEYQQLVQSLIENQTDPLIAERLTAAFNNLMYSVQLTCERIPRLKFRENFDKFIVNVNGFLFIK